MSDERPHGIGHVVGGELLVVPLMHCSFCGTAQRNVKRMVVGPCVTICDVCVALCVEVLGEREAAPEERPDCPVEPGVLCADCPLGCPKRDVR